jgi:lipid-A-disaccharide synthase
MAAQGVRLLCPASELAVVGLSEVAARLPAVLRALLDLARALKQERPDLVILVDFPDFNFWVARLAKFFKVPVMYYISPQVWAWRTYRVNTIARLVDRMVVIFPFEEEFYRERGVPVSYVGHPLRETLPAVLSRRELLAAWGLNPDKLTLALLPGSRDSEVKRHLPLMLAAAKLIHQSIPTCQLLLPLASTVGGEVVEGVLGGGSGSAAPCPPPRPPSHPFKGLGEGNEGRGQGPMAPGPLPPISCLKILPGNSYEALVAADLAVVASGTATVEAALAGVPTVIVYRLAPLSYRVGRCLIQVPHIGMANLLAGERLFPELLQEDFTPEALAREVLTLIREPGRLERLRQGLARVVRRLGGPGASARAAVVALELIGLGGEGQGPEVPALPR